MLNTKEEIEIWLKKFNITNYFINDDLTVDVNKDVDLHHREITELPIQFGIVKGSFWAFAGKLTSLKGSPYEVTKCFHCALNSLTTLDYCPKIIGTTLNCSGNPLTSLNGFNSSIGDTFIHSCLIDEPFKILELESHYIQYEKNDHHRNDYFRVDISAKELEIILAHERLKKELVLKHSSKDKRNKL